MTLALTQSDFRAHIKKYLDQVNDDDEVVYVARSNSRSVAVLSQEITGGNLNNGKTTI